MHMPRKQWYTHRATRTGRMRTEIREFSYRGWRGQKHAFRYVTVQFEIERYRYFSAWPACVETPDGLHIDTVWIDATPDDFTHTETIVFDRSKGDKE